jgi:hypothetical protein
MTEHNYWFSARRYGWGWSLPSSWEGWVVLAVFLGLTIVGSFVVLPGAGAFAAYVAILVALFFGVCWLKGEPLRWRWGKD